MESDNKKYICEGKDSEKLIIKVEGHRVLIGLKECILPVSLKCPQFILEGLTFGGDLKPSSVRGDFLSENPIGVSFEPIIIDGASKLEVKLWIQWFPSERLMRKWISYRIDNISTLKVLDEIILECLDSTEENPVEINSTSVQSYPAFLKGFFAGVEFPVASSRMENGKLFLAHKPGLRMMPGVWYESRKVVFGIADAGKEKEAFQRYLSAHMICSKGFFINYNSWWTSPVPYTESDILKLMQQFKGNIYDEYGASFDTFCIDMGWSDPHSIWEIDSNRFQEGFVRLQQASASMGCSLSLWISPGSCYEQALDNNWAKEQGFETSYTIVHHANDWKMQNACLGGKLYPKAFKDSIIKLVSNYKIRHLKLDGLCLECRENDHGHEPGPLSSEAIAEGAVSAFTALRDAMPDIWLEATCFGWNPSPWWLFYVNSVLGTYGDDAPFGRVPSPIHRESYTTARDYFSLQSTNRISIPIKAQEVLGVIHQSEDAFLNDAVMTIMRGHAFLPVYLNPKFMTKSRWKTFSSLIKWIRDNSWLPDNTEPLLPISWLSGSSPCFSNDGIMPREPYGYAHWRNDGGMVAIRNPWILPCTYQLKIPDFSDNTVTKALLDVVSIYPEVRLYGAELKPGNTLDILLAPYETVVFSIASNQSKDGIVNVRDALTGYIKANILKCDLLSIQSNEANKKEDNLNEPKNKFARQIYLEAEVDLTAPQAEVLVLIEGESEFIKHEYKICINGEYLNYTSNGSEDGWASSLVPKKEKWLFLRTPIVKGNYHVQIELAVDEKVPKVSVWIWATKPGKPELVEYPNVLPEPEIISLDAIALLNNFPEECLNNVE